MENNDWKLKKIEIEFKDFGEYKRQYVGKVVCQNGEYESFRFKLRPDMAKPYIDLIADDIVKAASNLGEKLMESLGLEKK